MLMGTNAVESPSNNRSPRGGGGDGGNSPQSRRTGGGTARNLSSPWANVVRGGGSVEREAVASTASTAAAAAPPCISLPSVAEAPPPDPALESDWSPGEALPPGNAVTEASPERPDNAGDGSGNAAKAAKKPAWNKPSNGVVIETGPVMGAAWPALSESARVSAKSSDSLRAPSDGSTPVSASTGPATASPLHKPTTNNSTPNHVFPARHKSSKRGSGGMGPTNNGVFVPLPAEAPLSAPDKPAAAAAEAPPDSSPRDPPNKNNNWEAGPRAPVIQQSHVGTDLPRGPFRRGNGGPRGDGTYHGGYGNRRDHERTNYEWNQPQGFNGRDVHVRQPRALPRNFIRPPAPAPGPFVAPPPIRPYGGPMGFPGKSSCFPNSVISSCFIPVLIIAFSSDLPAPQYYIPVPPPESVRGGPFVAHQGPPPPMFYTPPAAAQLQTMLIKQIDYYFR
ncbi:hypothetical protein ACLOJK_041814 [Asimina triloba]